MKPQSPYRDKIASLVKRAKRAREGTQEWLTKFEELAHYFHTTRQGFTVELPVASDLQDDIWSSEPEKARRRFSQAFVGAMCPKDRQWLGLQAERPELRPFPEVQAWCALTAQAMQTVVYDPRVNFFENINEAADDATAFGTAIVYVGRNVHKRHLDIKIENAKNFAFEQDINGNITAQYKFEDWTLSDLVNEFGEESLPNDLLEKWKDINCNDENKYPVIHIIMPNKEYERYGIGVGGKKRLPMSSIWILDKDNHELLHDGYYDFPYVVVRWYRRSGEAWGRSDAEIALPDARLAQAVSAALLEITEKQGNPPMMGPIDILRGEIEMFPGGFTPFDASGFQFQGDPLRPVQIGSNPAMTHEYLVALEKKINEAFHGDVLSPPPPKNSQDASMAQQNLAIRLGPIFSRAECEFLPPILERIFSIMLNANAIPPIPKRLLGERIIYRFDNHISEMVEIAEAQRSVQGVGMMAQFQVPEVMENIDWDSMARGVWGKMRVPQEYMRPIADVQKAREERMKMQQAAQMAEIARNAGPGLKGGVDAMKTAQENGIEMPQQ